MKKLHREQGEVKSMGTPESQRRRGAGRAVLVHIIEEGRRRGYKRLSLETGSMAALRPAWTLYESLGFRYCGAFADYKLDPHSVFMTLEL